MDKGYGEGETARARLWVEDAEAASRQEHEDTETAENAGLTIRLSEKMFLGMMVAIGDSLSNIASSCNGKDGEDQNDEETAGQAERRWQTRLGDGHNL